MDGTCYLTSDDINNIPSSKQLARLGYDVRFLILSANI